MNNLMKLTLAGALAALATLGCDTVQQVAPEKSGERNDSCLAKNDCGDGLSCINTRCQPTNFKLDPQANECTVYECDEDTDCCGDRPATAPPECNGRESICEQPNIPGCISTSCTSDMQCDGGTCGAGFCADTFTSCSSDSDCTPTENVCNAITEICSETGDDCSVLACPPATNTNTCTNRSCDCDNPDYDPTDPICDNQDCEDLCTLVCDLETNRCEEDTSCATDTDCFGLGLRICTDAGACIQCETTEDCDEENNEECTAEGFCERPCEFDQECGAFESCQSGECVYTGCTTDRDCVLYSSFPEADRRLAKCTDGPSGMKECLLPCDHDGHCNELSVCEGGFCQMLGCETNGQCDRFLGLQNQDITTARPYVSQGMCVDVESGEPVEPLGASSSSMDMSEEMSTEE